MKAGRKNYYDFSRRMSADSTPKPEKPDVKPQTDRPEIRKPDIPEVTPGKVKEPEVRPDPGKPEIHPGKKEPDIPSPAPPEPHE